MNIKGATAIVTGGASGLGEGTSIHLHSLGANVVIADVQEEKGLALAEKLGPSAVFASVDVTKTAQIEAAVDLAVQRFGKVDILVNCAGIAVGDVTVSRSRRPANIELFQSVINVNLVGTFDFTRLCALRMSENEPNEEGERGVVVNTSSINAFEGPLGSVAYTASKAGVAGMTLTIARDLGPFGIRVCSIAPGPFETPMGIKDGIRVGVTVGVTDHNAFPKRFGRPDEFARLAQHIVENPMLNGETIRLDAGGRMPDKHRPVRPRQ